MNIGLLGYGKMGKAIESLLLEKGHTVSARVRSQDVLDENTFANTDVVIEFTAPVAATKNITFCLEHNIPVVVGTTGWYKDFPFIEELCARYNGKLFHATNYSVGVNIFFELNKKLAKLMNAQPQYGVRMQEIHHTEKLDSPSGTAITIAEGIIENIEDVKTWKEGEVNDPSKLPIEALRQKDVPGTHSVFYTSNIDEIEITHTAFSRQGFAVGSILAAEFLHKSKVGIYTMSDLLEL
jgi:4-hydroxy-tetrahydrodipicolinate reductase